MDDFLKINNMIKKIKLYFNMVRTIRIQQELISWLATYNKVMQDELAETASIAHVHGWRSTKFEIGVKCRKTISKLTDKLYGKEDRKTEGEGISPKDLFQNEKK